MERFRVVGGTSLRGEVPVVGCEEQRPEADGGGAARRRADAADQRAGHRRRDDHGRAAAPARAAPSTTTPPPAWSRSTCRSRSATAPTTTWSGRCAPRSPSSARWWPAAAQADVAVPGGDAIGSRGLDLHAAGLEALGATVHVTHGYLVAEAPHGLHGADIRLDFPSVGATENVLSAAVLAAGRTRLSQRRPRAGDRRHRRRCSISMGARIAGAGTSVIEVEGVDGAARRPTTPSSPTGSPPAPGRSPPPPRAATSRSSGEWPTTSPCVLDALVHASGADVETTDAAGFRVERRGPRPRPSTSPRCPTRGSRPTCSRSRWPTTRSPTGQRHDHREPLRGALPHGAGAGPARRRGPRRRPPRHGPRRRAGSPARRSRPATSAPAPPW